jgi:hypothetical protein
MDYRQGRLTFTKDAVIQAMHKFNDLYGRPPTRAEWSPPIARQLGHPELAERFHADGCWPSFKMVRRLFGSWNDAIAAAGFEPRKSRAARQWTRDDLIAAATRYVMSLPPDMPPSSWGFCRSGLGPKSVTTIKRVIAPAELWDVVQKDVLGAWPILPADPPDPDVRITVERTRAIDVFAADGFCCTYCGRSPSEHGVVLHVDHKIPVSRGGSNARENLTTACHDCNLEKSDRLLPRMPPGVGFGTTDLPRYEPPKKYPNEDVLRMWAMKQEGFTHREIGQRFGITRETVRELLKNRSVVKQARLQG